MGCLESSPPPSTRNLAKILRVSIPQYPEVTKLSSKEKNKSLKVDSCYAAQDSAGSLRNSKVPFRIHKSPPTDQIPSQLNLVLKGPVEFMPHTQYGWITLSGHLVGVTNRNIPCRKWLSLLPQAKSPATRINVLSLSLSLSLHIYIYIYIHTHTYIYTGCNRRNGPDFGRVFLRSNYTVITKNTYIQSWTVTEILDREKSGFLWCLRTVLVGDIILPPTWTEFLCYR